MANEQNNNNNRIDIEIDAETAQGKYANLAIISHSHSEFVLDFASLLPGLPKAKVRSRIILTPRARKTTAPLAGGQCGPLRAQCGQD